MIIKITVKFDICSRNNCHMMAIIHHAGKMILQTLMSVFNNIIAWSPLLMRYDNFNEIFLTISTDQ